MLQEQGEPLEHVYFPESGVVSIVTTLESGDMIETGTVGSEGFVGVSAVLGVEFAPSRAFCQVKGAALRLPLRVVRAEYDQGTMWFKLLLRYVHFLHAFTAQSAACNRMHNVDARMSRWLLMTHDRVPGDTFQLTQEFLAQMLGVARPTVNIAAGALQRAGFVNYTRGQLTVVDRAGLESGACECYARTKELLAKTLGPGPTQSERA